MLKTVCKMIDMVTSLTMSWFSKMLIQTQIWIGIQTQAEKLHNIGLILGDKGQGLQLPGNAYSVMSLPSINFIQ